MVSSQLKNQNYEVYSIIVRFYENVEKNIIINPLILTILLRNRKKCYPQQVSNILNIIALYMY